MKGYHDPKTEKKYTSVALLGDSFLLIKSLLSPSWLQFSGTITRYFAINFVFINVFFWLNKKATERKKKKSCETGKSVQTNRYSSILTLNDKFVS